MKAKLRIVSLVPSWTETFLRSGINVIGRTRYCVHPKKEIEEIPVLGGTKDADWALIDELKPDFIVVDREENPKIFASESKWPLIVTHVTSLKTLAEELDKLAIALGSTELSLLSKRTKLIIDAPPLQQPWSGMDWLTPPKTNTDFVYIIWRNPWIATRPETFIGSVLDRLGLSLAALPTKETYPKIELNLFSPVKTSLLFSTEPYPFARHKKDLHELGFPSALIDGESCSWFGIRSIEFLEGVLFGPQSTIP
jgi:hypothetical protein